MINRPDSKPFRQWYAHYTLAILTFVYVLNFLDRQLLSILAVEIKADLGVSDAQMGFLYGTAFAVFYALFGIPLGRLADTWSRKNLIAVGLGLWSIMTALSGTARGFLSLSFFRIGVGIGEASASPAAYSILSDLYPPRVRATVLAIYSSGAYIGLGIGLFLGGWIVDAWNHHFPDPSLAPLHLKGWQAAFVIIGSPGLLIALWVWTLREPERGQNEDIVATESSSGPFRHFVRELIAVIPPFTLLSLYLSGARRTILIVNIVAAAGFSLFAWLMIRWLGPGSSAQWLAMSIGLYAVVSWGQGIALRDPPIFSMIFHCRSLIYAMLGFPCIAFVSYGIGFWIPSYFIRTYGVSLSEAGTILGLSAAIGGLAGVTIGGIVADKLRQRFYCARLYVGIATVSLTIPTVLVLLTSNDLNTAYIANFCLNLFIPMWFGPAASTVNDLVLPRMRATATAFYFVIVTFVGLAMGPYAIGELSDYLITTGMNSTDSLRTAMMSSLLMLLGTLACLPLAARHLERDELSRLQRATDAGEQFNLQKTNG